MSAILRIYGTCWTLRGPSADSLELRDDGA